MTELPIVEGWTGNLDFVLESNGAAFDLSSASSVAFVAHRAGRPELAVERTATVLDAANGKVRFTPQAGDFSAKQALYDVRFKIVISGQIVYFPNAEPIRLKVAY